MFSFFVLTACTSIKPSGTAGATQQSAIPTGIAATPPNSQITTPTQATPTIQPQQGIPGWQQYQSANLGISIAYPAGWSAAENEGEVAFTAPGGANILLDQVQASDLSPQDFLNQNQLPNTRCSSGKNSYGVQYHTCFDTIALSTTAYLVINPTQGSTKFFTLSTFTRGNLDVFNAMLASFHAS